MTSEKQIQANKLNAQNSTGAKSTQGKAIVAKNALKHGILSSEVVLETSEIGENKKEFEDLQNSLFTDLKPMGILEEILVDRIATTYWRLRRVIRAENGAIRRQTDDLDFKQLLKKAEQADHFDQYPALTDYRNQRLRNSIGALRAKQELEELKRTVEDMGYLPEAAFKEYVKLTNIERDEKHFSFFMFFNENAQGRVEGEEKEKGKKALLFTLEADIKAAKASEMAAEEMEQHETEALAMALSVPSEEVIDKIARYETTLENQLHKAINQLIKLQTIRKGGKVISAQAIEIESIEP